jgi:hypothetical protein
LDSENKKGIENLLTKLENIKLKENPIKSKSTTKFTEISLSNKDSSNLISPNSMKNTSLKEFSADNEL